MTISMATLSRRGTAAATQTDSPRRCLVLVPGASSLPLVVPLLHRIRSDSTSVCMALHVLAWLCIDRCLSLYGRCPVDPLWHGRFWLSVEPWLI